MSFNTDNQKGKLSSLPEEITEELNSLVEISDDLIFTTDAFGVIKYINRNGAVLLGFNEALPERIYFIELFKPGMRPVVLKILSEINKQNEIRVFEAEVSGNNKIEIPFKLRIKGIFRESQLAGIIGIGKNLSLVKKLEEKINELSERVKETSRILSIERKRGTQKISMLEELNKMKEEFASNISHEFRTPLASIIGFSESIAADPSMPQEHQREFNEIILLEGKRLAKLVNDVLDISEPEHGGTSLYKTKFNFINMLDDVIDKNLEKIKTKGLIFSKDYPLEEININADKEKLSQAFDNLLDNSIKFTGKGGRISVFIKSLYKEFEVIITDTGIGIAKKNLPFIFQKYSSDNKSVRETFEKNLGLVFVKHIVDLHKGSISFQSEMNEGTSVIVKLRKEE